jgi:type IV secretory pathway TraG/TraD family ATPase VirD4
MTSGWWTAAQVLWKGASALGRGTQNAFENAAQNWPSKSARLGLLGPWDAPPNPQAMQVGAYDYRGVARPSDIGPVAADFPLGYYREPRRWTATDPIGLSENGANQHTIVLGPTRSGKTASIIAPWIHAALKLGYSVLAVDVKGHDDLLSEIKRYAAYAGTLGVPVIKWDYSDPGRSASWNWIGELHSDSEINAAVEAICGRPSPNDPNKFFHQSAIKYLRGILQLASAISGGVDLKQILMLLNDQVLLEGIVRVKSGHPGAQRLSELCGLSQSEFIKHTMELKTHLETLNTQGFEAVTDRSQISFDSLRSSQPCLLIVTAPVADGALADAASSLFLGQFFQHVLSGFGAQGSSYNGSHSGTNSRPVLLVLDEAARVQKRIDLGATLSLVAGAGVSVLLATQDVSQFEDDKRDEILANCGTMLCLPRVSKATTDYFIGRMGEMQFVSRSQGRSTGREGTGRTWTQSVEKSAVLGHREISSPHPALGAWPAVVHAPSLSSRPIIVDLTRRDMA